MNNIPLSIMRTVIGRFPAVVPHLTNQARRLIGLELKALADINASYHDTITTELTDYFEGSGSVTAPRNHFRTATTEAFYEAFGLGWTDNGQEYPIDPEAQAWLDDRTNQEYTHIDELFQEAKQLRAQEDFDYFTWITARADGYTSTLHELYNAGAMWAGKNQMLTWRLGETEKHCETCKKLDGTAHRASWYLSHDYIPRKPGAAMDCKGYNCDCSLTDKKGNEVTI